MKWSAVLVAALLVACSASSDAPSSSSTRPPETLSPETPATAATTLAGGWNVSDTKVTTRDELAYWIVSYDAKWEGGGPPEEQKCVFKVRNQDEIVVWQSGEILTEGDDVEADIIYPDEVPGQPRTVSVECGESG